MKLRWLAGIVAALAGAGFGAVILWIAFQENSQDEYFDSVTGQIDVAHSAELFLAAALPAALVTFAVVMVVGWIVRVLRG